MNWLTLVPPAIAFVVFLALGVVTWSYRDVYHRHTNEHDLAGHERHEDSTAASDAAHV
jgi:hypothetical protein